MEQRCAHLKLRAWHVRQANRRSQPAIARHIDVLETDLQLDRFGEVSLLDGGRMREDAPYGVSELLIGEHRATV